MDAFFIWLDSVLGLHAEPRDLTLVQICGRGVIVFAATLIMVRLSDRRALTRKSPFDTVLLVVLGSTLARAVNGSASFFSTLGGAFALVMLHRALAFCTCQWPAFGALVRGRALVLMRDGKMERATMRRLQVAQQDVWEDFRLQTHKEDLAKVEVARLEAGGDISFVLKESKEAT